MHRLDLFIVVFLACFFVPILEAKQTVCLNMIVKDESEVILRCLQSVKPLIDYWVIVDTGSTDGTQAKIKEFMKEIPGELHERPWINFEHNRNEALKLAKGKSDYLLFIDADDYLTYETDYKFPPLEKDFYFIPVVNGMVTHLMIHLVNSRQNWAWTGVLHEILLPSPISEIRSYDKLENIVNVYTNEGARSKDPNKFIKDAQLLESELKKDPTNHRNLFYLARTFMGMEEYEKALKTYEQRVVMGGWEEEVFESLLQIAVLHEKLKMPADKVIKAYQRAFEFRPTRAESLFYLASFYRSLNDDDSAFRTLKIAAVIPLSNDILFMQRWMYEWGILLELSASAYWSERYEESQRLCLKLLEQDNLPAKIRALVKNNLDVANKKGNRPICKKGE